jgi:hypothetical protein
LLRLDEAEDEYQRVLELNVNFPGAKENLALTQKLLAAENDDRELEPKHMDELEAALTAQKRLDEASTVKKMTGLERGKFLRELSAAIALNPELKPLGALIADRKDLRQRFHRREDGTWSASFKSVNATVFSPLLRSNIVRISMLYLDDTEVPDLAILSGMKELRVLSLTKSRGVTDLSPLAGLPLETLSLSGTDVKDLTPLKSMPLAELRLDGCKKIVDLTPLNSLQKLSSLTLPQRGTVNIDSLREMKSIERLGFAEPPISVEKFWKQQANRPAK